MLEAVLIGYIGHGLWQDSKLASNSCTDYSGLEDLQGLGVGLKVFETFVWVAHMYASDTHVLHTPRH